MSSNFTKEYICEAEDILDIYGKLDCPESLLMSELNRKFIQKIDHYRTDVLNVSMISLSMEVDGTVVWDDLHNYDSLENELYKETLHRVRWFYDKTDEMHVDNNFIARILETLDNVGYEITVRDFL